MPRVCPECKKTLTRIQRKFWMRRIPGSKHYLCRECGYAYLLIFNRWLLKRKLTHRKSASSRGS
jgi:transposase-like protein